MAEVDESEEELSEEDITPKRSQVDMLLGDGFQPSKSQSLSTPVVQTSQQTTGDDDSVTGISDSWNTLLSLIMVYTESDTGPDTSRIQPTPTKRLPEDESVTESESEGEPNASMRRPFPICEAMTLIHSSIWFDMAFSQDESSWASRRFTHRVRVWARGWTSQPSVCFQFYQTFIYKCRDFRL